MPSDFDELVESYLPAAAVLGLARSDVERAVRAAAHIVGRCPPCRHSRASAMVMRIATERGLLATFSRRCTLNRLPFGCRCFEWLELPPVADPAPVEEERA